MHKCTNAQCTVHRTKSKPPVKRVVCTGPKRAWYRRATEVPLNDPPTALFSRAAAKAAVLFCLSNFVTRKRVYVFVKTYLVTSYVLLQLVSYVFFNDFFISANCINIVSSAPKMAISILVFQICVSVKYHQTALSFQVSHKLRYTQLGWNRYKHMHMIFAKLCLVYLYTFLLTQLSQYHSNIFVYLSIYHLSAIFRCKYYMILAIPLGMC